MNTEDAEEDFLKFRNLSDKWKEETLLTSSVNEIESNPSYLEIIKMGKKVLPYIFQDLKSDPTFWFSSLLPTICRALDLRIYKGKPTVIKRSDFVIRIVRYARGLITEEEVLKWDIWQEKILPSIGPTDTIVKLSALPVGEHEKELTSDRYTNKKGETIKVGRYIRMQKQIEKLD